MLSKTSISVVGYVLFTLEGLLPWHCSVTIPYKDSDLRLGHLWRNVSHKHKTDTAVQKSTCSHLSEDNVKDGLENKTSVIFVAEMSRERKFLPIGPFNAFNNQSFFNLEQQFRFKVCTSLTINMFKHLPVMLL